VLRGAKNFAWGPEQADAFEDIKSYLTHLATLSSPAPGADLLLYLAASHHEVSAVLVQENLTEGRLVQSLVYFVSEVLTQSKTHMLEMEKIAYVVVMATRKLRHYFEAHKIKVLTELSLSDIYSNLEAFARIGK
jgi:glucose-6-phosphate-specific signal transduction histidine kinase